ncbi:hypothetical protein JRQ81_008726 [Phrynocephalus forsythii]|uniref:Mitochondrial import inner membrane translocase subunit TIM44 n=1 Tax=Phrynocephalus forsythii TaxID=171643 RepID=A0A9Q0XB30_9SAUR|nr:hypothetical protein JRQ81_008726 [Phrynocephalus forsythii]
MAAVALWGCRKCLQNGWLLSRQGSGLARDALLTFRTDRPSFPLNQPRYYSSGGGRKGFISGLVDNIKQELAKNKEMKENIQKFRDEAKKLEESEALQEARRKYSQINRHKPSVDPSLWFRPQSLDEVGKSDLGRKIKEGVEEAAKTAKQSAESVSRGGEKLGRTAAFKAISQGVETVRKEIDESVLGQTGPYKRPERLRKRTEFAGERLKDERVFEANEYVLGGPTVLRGGVVLHKDSKWYQQWKEFKDNNVVFNRFFEMKMKYDESDNAVIRATRVLTDKVTDFVGGIFSKTEMSEVLTEILRVDPNFDKDRFLKQCENDIIPNAMICGDLDVLKDWCYEATYSQLAQPIQQARAMGLHYALASWGNPLFCVVVFKQLAMGKMMDQGPVLIITFQAQLVMVIKNQKAEVVEGDPEKVLRMMYVWALCRDPEELNPYAAWRLLDISASSTEQIL